MRGVNKVTLIGNLGKDPEIKYMPSGKAVANFTLATSSVYKNSQDEVITEVEWHRITAFGKPAEIIGEYTRKGSKLYVGGKIKTEKWQDDQGNDKYATKIICEDFQLLDSKSDSKQDKENESIAAPTFNDDIPF